MEHGRTKGSNVPRPSKIPTHIQHGRTKGSNVLRPNKTPTYTEQAVLSVLTY